MARVEIRAFIEDGEGSGMAGVRMDGAMTSELSPHECMALILRLVEGYHLHEHQQAVQPVIQLAHGSPMRA